MQALPGSRLLATHRRTCAWSAMLPGMQLHAENPEFQKYEKQIFYGAKILPRYFLIQDWSNNCLVVDACRSSSGTCGDVLWPRTILPDKIDMQYISSIISTCSANHDDCRIYGTQVEGLSVIDCMTSNIILAPPDCQYLALSYVWGATGEKKDTFPKVVQDSITVAKELGYKYLWVDRYCIDQDATHQQHIFNQMHRIYSGASVTIIAAAGNDAEHGLPGVSVRRPDQISLQFDYLHLTQILPYDETDIVGSTWNTRAWTYQESYFSTRRLIFTEKQVLYICNESRQAEALPAAMALSNSPGSDLPQLRHPFIVDIDALRNDITIYTQRHLTYSSDSLNAILGVIRYYMEFSSDDLKIRNIWGVPLYLVLKSQELLLDLAWFHRSPGRRRPEFPSWSWAGWEGGVDWDSHLFGREIDWFCQDDSQQIFTRESLLTYAEKDGDHPRGLVIAAKISPVFLEPPHGSEDTSSFGVRFPSGDGYILVDDCSWDEPPSPNGEYYAVDLDKHHGSSTHFLYPWDEEPYCMMILEKKGHQFERIGISNDGCCHLYDADGVSVRNQNAGALLFANSQTERICII
ncbi:HET-domain-containing protein [Apiospora saccharicola]